MNQTYSETQGEEPFNWWDALSDPPAMESEEHDYLRQQAEDWATCATGNQCSVIPRKATGEPVDPALSGLGMIFMADVRDGRWQVAKSTLSKIEARAAIIIAEERTKLNAEARP